MVEYLHAPIELLLSGPKFHIGSQHILRRTLKLVEDLAASGSGLRS
jgi:hypothetical protein